MINNVITASTKQISYLVRVAAETVCSGGHAIHRATQPSGSEQQLLFAARSRQIQALTQQFTAQSQLLRQIGLLTAPAAAPTPVASAPL